MTAAARQLTQTHRAQQLLLRRSTVTILERLWPALDWAQLDSTYPAFAVHVGRLVRANRQTSAGLAAAYLRAFRKANGVPGEVKVVFAQPLIVDQFEASLRTTSVAAIKSAAASGTAADVAMRDALVQSSGAMSRLVMQAGRETVRATAIADPRSAGWQRVGVGNCDFCRMLLDRGSVYSEETADFQAHDHCGCTAEPVY